MPLPTEIEKQTIIAWSVVPLMQLALRTRPVKDEPRTKIICEVLFRRLMANVGHYVPTANLIKEVESALKSSGNSGNFELKEAKNTGLGVEVPRFLKYAETNIGTVHAGPWVIKFEGDGRKYRIDVERADNDHASGAAIVEARHLLARFDNGDWNDLRAIQERSIIAYATGDRPFKCTVKIIPPKILGALEKTVRAFDKELAEDVEWSGAQLGPYNRLRLGAESLAIVKGSGNILNLALEPVFYTWYNFLLSRQRFHKHLFMDDGKISAVIRPLKIAVLIATKTGYVVSLNRGLEGDPNDYSFGTTCRSELEILCLGDLDKDPFDLERCICLMLFQQLGFRCHPTEVKVLGCIEEAVIAPPEAPRDWTEPCLLVLLTPSNAPMPGVPEPEHFTHDRFKYLFKGRRDRHFIRDREWTSPHWTCDEAQKKALDPSSRMSVSLRLLILLAEGADLSFT